MRTANQPPIEKPQKIFDKLPLLKHRYIKQENMPLTIETFHDEQAKECHIASARQIRSLLRGIAESGASVALYFDGAKDFIMTSLLEVSDIGLWVEQGTDTPINQRIAESSKIALVSLLDQGKIQFAANEIRAVTYQGYSAFYLPLPDSLYRIQRRDFYRLAMPLSEQLRCVIPINWPQAGGKLELPVMDISIGGVRLFYADHDIEFVLGQIYGGCQIDLQKVGKISFTMAVKSVVSISPKHGQTARRVGCEFKNLDNASGILLQRYVTNVQRLRAAAQKNDC